MLCSGKPLHVSSSALGSASARSSVRVHRVAERERERGGEGERGTIKVFESSNKALYPRAPEKVFRTPPPPPLQGLLGRGHAGMNLLSGCSSVLEPCSWLRPHSSDSVRSDKTSQSQRESLAPSELHVHVLLISVLQKSPLSFRMAIRGCRFVAVGNAAKPSNLYTLYLINVF